jgi:hypothetical protein
MFEIALSRPRTLGRKWRLHRDADDLTYHAQRLEVLAVELKKIIAQVVDFFKNPEHLQGLKMP